MEKIIKFFDELSKNRDKKIKSDPIIDYEQRTRLFNIIDLLDAKHGELILDIGCGDCRDARVILKKDNITYVGVDLSSGMLAEAAKKNLKIHLARAGILTLPFKDKIFDKIICSEVLEHVPEWEEALGELKRVLHDRGCLIISTPNMLSLYFPQKLILEKRKGKGHPYDEWKNFFLLRRGLRNQGVMVKEVRGSCYLPGLIAYRGFMKRIITNQLPLIEWIEHKIMSRSWGKYFGYTVIIKAVKTDSQ